MRTRLIGTLAAATLVLAACGGGDDGGSSAQDQVADMMIDVLNEAGAEEGIDLTIDEDCIRDKASGLSDADANALVEAGVDGDPEVSAEADAIGDSIFECVDLG